MYVVGAVVMAGGCGASVGGSLWRVMSEVEDMQRVVVPGSHDLELQSRTYTIYWESRSVVDGTAYMNPGQATVRCQLGTPAGEPVSIRGASVDKTYTFGSSYQGESLFEFDIDRPGTYRLSCEMLGESSSQGVLAIGQGMAIGSIVLGLLGGMVAFGLGLFIILRTHMRRRPTLTVYSIGPPRRKEASPSDAPPRGSS